MIDIALWIVPVVLTFIALFGAALLADHHDRVRGTMFGHSIGKRLYGTLGALAVLIVWVAFTVVRAT